MSPKHDIFHLILGNGYIDFGDPKIDAVETPTGGSETPTQNLISTTNYPIRQVSIAVGYCR
jgi:hypothetical protein